MEELFANKPFESRMNEYFEVLLKNRKINSVASLLECMTDKIPNDVSINYNRVQRDVKEYLKRNNISDSGKNPIADLRPLAMKKYMPMEEQDFFVMYGLDVLYDFPNIFIKTKPYDATQFGQYMREKHGDICPFVISDFDTVLLRFKTKEAFNELQGKIDGYISVLPDNDGKIPESR